jgi:hypothetical protein
MRYNNSYLYMRYNNSYLLIKSIVKNLNLEKRVRHLSRDRGCNTNCKAPNMHNRQKRKKSILNLELVEVGQIEP